MLSKLIDKGRPTTTKLTFVALPNLTSHSTFHECSRGIFYQPQYSPHDPLTKLGVIILYFLRLERKIISPSTFIICWNTTMESTPTKLIYSRLQKRQRPSKLVSNLPTPLPNQWKSYLRWSSHLRRNNLYRFVTRSRHLCTFTATQVMISYDAYTASPAKKTT